MSKVTNTTANENNSEWIIDDIIKLQEARGQAELVNSEQLPSEIHGREKLEAAGVVFGEPLSDDPIFCEAVLPKGWQKRATDRSMWSHLVDADGKVRATIFYKAAFYDRNAVIYAKDA